MSPQTRSLLCKVIIIGASICLGAFIAFKFFRTGIQEIVDAEEIVESSSPSMASENDITADDIIKMHRDIESSISSMTEAERKEFAQKLGQKFDATAENLESLPLHKMDQVKAALAGKTKEERQEYYKKAEANLPNVIKEHNQNVAARKKARQEAYEKYETEEEMGQWAKDQEKELDEIQAHIKKDHKKTQPYEAPCPTCTKHADRLTEQEAIIAEDTPEQPKTIKAPAAKKQEAKKPEQKKPAVPKASEKKPAATKKQEAKGKKAPAGGLEKKTQDAKLVAPVKNEPAKVEPVKPAMPKEVVKPMVTVKNNIRKDMTGYRKFGKKWYPDEYSVTINGVQVGEGEQIAVPSGDGSVCNVVFAYDFRPMGKSYKKGTEQVNYVLTADTKKLDISFSWYETPCIIVTPVMGSSVSSQGGSKVLGA